MSSISLPPSLGSRSLSTDTEMTQPKLPQSKIPPFSEFVVGRTAKPAPLTAYSVEVGRHHLLVDLSQNLLPTRFWADSKPKKFMEIYKIKNIYRTIVQASDKNVPFRFHYMVSLLILADFYRRKDAEKSSENGDQNYLVKKVTKYLTDANEQYLEAKKINQYHPLIFYMESILMEFHGIDCLIWEKVAVYIKLLRTAAENGGQSFDSRTTLDTAVQFLKDRWKRLNSDGDIDQQTYTQYLLKLDFCLAEELL